MPRRESWIRRALLLWTVCCLSVGCGLPSKRMSLDEAVDELEDVELAESGPEDSATPSQPPSQNPDVAAEPGGTRGNDLALVSAEEPIGEREVASSAADPVTADRGAAQEPNAHASQAIEKVNSDSFDTVVLKADTPVLVDFYAPWCGPCKKLAPILDELAADTPGVKVVKVDIEESKPLAKSYRVRSVPTLILFKQGEPVSEHRGIADRRALETLLAR